MLARPYSTITPGTFDNSTVVGILEYRNPGSPSSSSFDKALPIFKPMMPYYNDTNLVTNFTTKLRSLATKQYPAAVPQSVDRRFFFTIGLGTLPCPKNMTCQGPNGTQFAAAVREQRLPRAPVHGAAAVALHRPHQRRLRSQLPGHAPVALQLHGDAAEQHQRGHRDQAPRGVLQHVGGAGDAGHEHPRHREPPASPPRIQLLRGRARLRHAVNDPAKFNLVDPVERNTVGVPAGGWVAIRFLADNPGIRETQCTDKNLN
uniref:Plastocyanin-like domain-containing protein n=1 Tax=Hordeum vulgare subsp. vulgare TaxID=112509 RepID=A0A8I6XR27_HORVV